VQEISKKIQFEMDVIEKFKKTMNETDGELDFMRKYMKLDHNIVQVNTRTFPIPHESRQSFLTRSTERFF